MENGSIQREVGSLFDGEGVADPGAFEVVEGDDEGVEVGFLVEFIALYFCCGEMDFLRSLRGCVSVGRSAERGWTDLVEVERHCVEAKERFAFSFRR